MDYKRISEFEKNNPHIAFNVLFVCEKKEIESLECMQILFEELEVLVCIRYLFEKWVKRDAINDGRVYIAQRSKFNSKRSK